MKFRSVIFFAYYLGMLLLFAGLINLVVAKKHRNVVESLTMVKKRVDMDHSSSSSVSYVHRKAKPWFTPIDRMTTLSSGPSREGSGH